MGEYTKLGLITYILATQGSHYVVRRCRAIVDNHFTAEIYLTKVTHNYSHVIQ